MHAGLFERIGYAMVLQPVHSGKYIKKDPFPQETAGQTSEIDHGCLHDINALITLLSIIITFQKIQNQVIPALIPIASYHQLMCKYNVLTKCARAVPGILLPRLLEQCPQPLGLSLAVLGVVCGCP